MVTLASIGSTTCLSGRGEFEGRGLAYPWPAPTTDEDNFLGGDLSLASLSALRLAWNWDIPPGNTSKFLLADVDLRLLPPRVGFVFDDTLTTVPLGSTARPLS